MLQALLDTNLEPLHRARTAREPAPLDETLRAIARHAVQAIEANLDLWRIILREALAGDAAAARRYRALLDLWERRVNARLLPFRRSKAMTDTAAARLSRQIVYIIAMAVQDQLLLQRRNAGKSQRERSEELLSFLATAVPRLAGR